MVSAAMVAVRPAECELSAVYGKFSARQLAPKIEFAVTSNRSHFLGPVRVRASGMATRRERNGLNAEWHNHFFLMQQISGQTHVGLGDCACVLRPNDLVMLDAFEACEYLTPRRSEVVLIAFPLDLVDNRKLLADAFGRRINGASDIGRVLSASFSAAHGQTNITKTQDRRAILDVLRILLNRVVDCDQTRAGVFNDAELIDQARLFVLAEIANPSLSPEMLASATALSRRQLYRLFESMGETPSAWIWALRLDEARERLISPLWADRTITEIAYAVGFNDLAHFSRAYRQRYGCTPRETRSNLKDTV